MRVLVKSFGCSANMADSEVLAGCLAEAGYRLVDSVDIADIVVFNTCAVKGPTENRVIEAIRRVSPNKRVVVAGCLPLISFDRLNRDVRFDGVVGPAAGDRIVDVVSRVSKGEKVFALEGAAEAKPSLNLPRVKRSPFISIVPICYGCLGSCAYCCTVFSRGRLRSHSIQEVVDRVGDDLRAGAKEFWITAQDTACFGRDIGVDLAQLLDAVCRLDEEFRVRVGMMTPNMVKDILSELIQVFKSEKIFKFIHLPVQSGDEQVLESMNRQYSIKDFRDIVGAFRDSFPEITLSTDVICGFPSESEEAFEKTIKLIEEVRPDVVNVSRFFARSKTAAAEMLNCVLSAEIKRRSTVASELIRRIALEKNQRWIGWCGDILVDEVGKAPGSWIGRNFAYKPIAVKTEENLLGRNLRVGVTEAFSTHLMGETVE